MKPDKQANEQNRSSGEPADEVIGRAFRWSVVALLLIVIMAGAGIYYVQRGTSSARSATPPRTARPSRAILAEIPEARFREITSQAGIEFSHANGAAGEKLLPETMGGGVAFIDYDNDGDQDLVFINSTSWPGQTPPGKAPTPALYANNGTGQFKDVTAGSGLDKSLYGMGVAVGDYDNDGWDDLFVTGVGESRLFHNERGKFRDVTTEAGLDGGAGNWSTSAAFIDCDNDGDVDLFVCNYVQWSRQIDLDVDYRLPGIGRAYGPPHNFAGSFPQLFRNDGGGRFTDVSARSGVQVKIAATGLPKAKSLGVSPVDIDGDGWIDLVVANDTVQNFVFHNQRDGTFKEIGAHSGIAFDSYGQTRGAMGIDAARFRNDNTLGIAIGNFANEMNALYVSRPDSIIFADEAVNEGVGLASEALLKFGLFFFDYDLDGRLDVLTANGHLDEQINRIQPGQHYRQPAQLFWNRGQSKGMSFVPVPPSKCGEDIFKPIVGRGSAYADIDGDADLDVVLTQISGPPVLLRNEQNLRHHWIRLKLVGRRSNRNGIGAWIYLRLGNRILSRQVMPAKGYLSQSELPVTIGLGHATTIDAVEIVWPSNLRQTISPPAVDRTHVIVQAP